MHVNPMAVAALMVEHVSTGIGETLYDAADGVTFEQAPDTFCAYGVRPVEVQDGLAVMDLATYLITVDFFDVRPREPGSETDAAVGARLSQIADLATDYMAWRGAYAVVDAVVVGFNGDALSEALAGQVGVTSGGVGIRMVVLT